MSQINIENKNYQVVCMRILNYLKTNFEFSDSSGILKINFQDYPFAKNYHALLIENNCILLISFPNKKIHFRLFFPTPIDDEVIDSQCKIVVLNDFEKILNKLTGPLKEFFLFRIDLIKNKEFKISLFDLYKSIFEEE